MILQTTEHKTEREIGMAAVQMAARLCEAVRAEMVLGKGPDKLDKQDRSPVTVADFGAQAIVGRLVGDAFSDDAIVAEEASAALREAANAGQLAAVARFVNEQMAAPDEETVCAWIDRGQATPGARFWVLDPIDGTKGFLRNDQYAIALALIEGGVVQRGFLGCPVLPYEGVGGEGGTGVLFVAERGAGTEAFMLDGAALDGASLDGTALGAVRVSALTEPTHARLAESVESAHTNRGLSAQLQEALGISGEVVRMDSQAKYAAVARGQAEIYLRSPNARTPEYRENIWDHAAGWIVVEEAGGRVTDVYGRPLDWTRGRRLENNVGVVATNAHLHDAVIETLARLLPPLPSAS